MKHSDISAWMVAAESVELWGEDTLTLEQLAQACNRTAQWLTSRVHAGVLTPTACASAEEVQSEQWRFSSAAVVRARRVSELERCFDADPQLAALTVDLMEEVALLRNRLHSWAKNKTLLLITHRTSMLSLVDRLIVLDNGHIVADGPKEAVIEALRKGRVGPAAL